MPDQRSTHKQALAALLFLYREVFTADLPWLGEIGRPSVQRRLPTVLSVEEVSRLLAYLDGVEELLARLIYGTGLRLMEALTLRIKNVDFARRAVIVRAGKGGKDRVVMLPATVVPALQEQLEQSRRI